jgi:Protein of unknown function, DUF547
LRTPALLLILLASFAAPGAARSGQAPAQAQAAGFDHTHALWTQVLKQHVKPTGFDYAGLKGDRRTFDAYLASLAAATPGEMQGWTREQRFAFWINVYNAYAIDLVVRNYPTDSIRSLGALFTRVWDREFIPLKAFHPEGKDDELSLDDVESGILRPQFEDARVHAAINCCSESCPPLRAEAFVAERLDEQLDQQARAWLADPSRNRYDRTATTIHVSKIFDWYAKDFIRDAGSLQAWIARYAPEPHAGWIAEAQGLKIEYLDYSWKLNAARRR